MPDLSIIAALFKALDGYPMILGICIMIFLIIRKIEPILQFISNRLDARERIRKDILKSHEDRIIELEKDKSECLERYYELRNKFAELESQIIKAKAVGCIRGGNCPVSHIDLLESERKPT